MDKRKKPEDVDLSDFKFSCFENWANENNVGMEEEDWIDWFKCWYDGYLTAKIY